MSKSRLMPVTDYLRETGSIVNKENLLAIRNCYREVLKLSSDADLPDDPKEDAIIEVGRRLNVRVDTDEARSCLKDCVSFNNIDDAALIVSGRLAGEEKPIEPSVLPKIEVSTTVRSNPSVSLNKTRNAISLTIINCRLIVKKPTIEVEQFIHSFLLQDLKTMRQQITTNSTSISIRYDEEFCLVDHCLLNLFIRKHLREHDVITLNDHQTRHPLRLIEPVNLTDDFGPWDYDHWCKLLDLELSPHGIGVQFPPRWRLADDARIYCCIYNPNSNRNISTSSHQNTPRISSLDAFVSDICNYENNCPADAWLKALRDECIFKYEHLDNLKQSEWDSIHKLPMNARKILKAAVDREREHAREDLHPNMRYDSDQEAEDDENTIYNVKDKPCDSHSELLANIHLIKLFIWDTLREERIVQRQGALPRLEAACLNEVFDEMHEEGFADDGLFPKMKEFFLPLTISEQELCIDRELDKQKRQTLMEHREKLKADICIKNKDYNEQQAIFWTYDDQIIELKKELKQCQDRFSKDRSTPAARPTDGQQQKQQVRELQQFNQKCHKEQADLTKKIRGIENLKNDLKKIIDQLEQEINEITARIENIDIELVASPKYVDKQLIKPARGLIMYGPPGTGKSEIMSKLAIKLGIVMVGPPLAAGELNRPLVGESERILIALCQRCNRVPYAMCCVSIDEIDSLAPKRDKDSSEGKIDKISVLLSLIEGIKDVPNLMILCATNRLHMMDEAFLRRMSGKFFVGRPSSTARTTILRSIPDSALEAEILDRLVVATTNFSGAAVRALTRAITVTCIGARRDKPDYRIDLKEAFKIADRVAQQYQILFGSETLPRLLLRNLHNNSRLQIRQLSNDGNYTGRIVVDLYSGHIRIEACTSQRDNMKHLSIIEHKLHSNETNVQSLLERLTVYGKNRNVQLLQLIDLNLLAAQGAFDEKKVFETLKDRYDECIGYTHSMIVYDLDALIGVNKSESISNMGQSTSSSVVNQSIYTYVRARFRDYVLEDEQIESTDRIERWVVAIIREPFLLRQFCTDVQFTRTRQEEEEMDLEQRKARDHLKCVKCKDFYIENENKMGNCVHHDGFVYDNSAADMRKYTASHAILLLNKDECDATNHAEQRDEFERQKTKFKWICCDAVLVSGNVGGCKRGKHGFDIPDNDELQQTRFDQNSTVRLDQNIIQKWEEACDNNEEYNEKWFILLGNRS